MSSNRAFQKVDGVANLYHRGRAYYARISVEGKQTWRSLDTEKITVAKKLLAKLQTGHITEIRRRREPGLHESMEATIAFRAKRRGASRPLSPDTVEFHQELLVLAKRTLPNRKLSRMITESILDAIADSGVGQSRRKAMFELVKGTYRRAMREGQTRGNPLEGHTPGQVARKDRTLPTRKELESIVADVEKRFPKGGKKAALTIRFLAFSGLRRGEALALTWANVKDGKLLVKTQHNGRRLKTERSKRNVQINPPLQTVLDEIESIYGRKGTVVPYKCVRAHLRASCEALGLEKLTNHDLRSWFATWTIQSGTDIATVADWLGDSPEVVLRRYVAVMDEHKKEAASKLR